MTEMVPVPICGREDWTVLMPAERAARVQWPWHEWNRFHSMFHNLRPGDVLFDIGAEQGDQSALYAKWVAPDCRGVPVCGACGAEPAEGCRHVGGIVLVEPNPVAWANIRAVWEANDLREPLGCFTEFVADEIHEPLGTALPWPRSARWPISKHVGTAEMGDESSRITIDGIANTRGSPDAITIDIEGGELDALKGATETLTHDRPLVWVSIHWQMLHARGQTRAELIDYMASFGYEHEHLGQDHEIHALFWHPEGREPVLPYG